MNITWMSLLAGSMLLQPFVHADVSYQETTQITGGSLMSMLKLAGVFSSNAKQANTPITATIALHGNRMVRSDPHTTEIIDLDQQTITNIDRDKHTYSVMTFQQMEQVMAKASAQMQAQAKTQPQPTNPSNPQVQVSFTAKVSSTGATRSIEGRDAKESLLSLTMMSQATDGSNAKAGMAVASEMWLVSDVPGQDELRAFHQRMASELAAGLSPDQMSGLLKSQPGGAEALSELEKQSAKINGIPVLQVTRFGISADGSPLPPPSVAPIAQNKGSSQAGEMGTEIATDTATDEASNQVAKLGGIGRALGSSSLGSLMRHKPSASSKPSTPDDSANAANAAVLLEAQTQTSNFSTAPVDPSLFQIPADYKQVNPISSK